MDKKQRIIQEYHFERMKIENKYKFTDGAKYLRTIPPDPYCQGVDMPKDKFPEYYKWYDEKNKFIKKYDKIIQPFANFKNGDFVIIKTKCNEIYIGKICSKIEFYYSEKYGSNLHYKTRKIYNWNEEKYPNFIDEADMVKDISESFFNTEIKNPLSILKSKLLELFENNKINDSLEKQKLISEYNVIRDDIHKRYWVEFDKGKDITDKDREELKIISKDDKLFKQKYSELICRYAKYKKGDMIILLDNKQELFFGKIEKEPFFEYIYDKSRNKICYDINTNYGWVSEYPIKPRTNILMILAYEEDKIVNIDKELLETEIVIPLYNIQKKIIEIIS